MEPSETDTIKYTPLACGRHHAPESRADRTCRKCGYLDKLHADPKYRAGLQYSGTPWIAVLGDPVPSQS